MQCKPIEPGVVKAIASLENAPPSRFRGRRVARPTKSRWDEIARLLTYGVILYSCVEGLVISIWHPSLLPHVFKDLGIVALYAVVFLPRPDRLIPGQIRALSIPMIMFAAMTLSYLVMSEMGVLVAIIGLKQKLFYLPLVAVGYFFIGSVGDLRRLLVAFVLSGLAVAVLGVSLHFIGPEGLRQVGAHYSAFLLTAPTGQADAYWRVPGTFTSPGQFGAYLFFNGLIAIAALLTNWLPRIWRLWAAGATIMIALALLASGSRAPILLLLACAVGLVALSCTIRRVAIAAITASLILGLVGYLGPGVIARVISIADSQHLDRFQRTYFGQLFIPALIDNPLGSGLGVATIGSRHFTDISEIRLVESYLGILAIEMGVPGLLAVLWVVAAIMLEILRLQPRMARSPLAVIWYALAGYVVMTIAVMPVSTSIDHAPTNFYFWFTIGVMIKLVELERRRRIVIHRSSDRQRLNPLGGRLKAINGVHAITN